MGRLEGCIELALLIYLVLTLLYLLRAVVAAWGVVRLEVEVGLEVGVGVVEVEVEGDVGHLDEDRVLGRRKPFEKDACGVHKHLRRWGHLAH